MTLEIARSENFLSAKGDPRYAIVQVTSQKHFIIFVAVYVLTIVLRRDVQSKRDPRYPSVEVTMSEQLAAIELVAFRTNHTFWSVHYVSEVFKLMISEDLGISYRLDETPDIPESK